MQAVLGGRPSRLHLRLITAPYMSRCMEVALRNAQLLPTVGGTYAEQVIWGKHTNGHTRYSWIQLHNEHSVEMLLRAPRSE